MSDVRHPMDLDPSGLVGRSVQLEPLAERHREGLRVAAADERIWQHTVSVVSGPGFEPWFTAALGSGEDRQEVPFAVRLRASGRVVGSSRFLDPVCRRKRVEIGSTWYAADVWLTPADPAATAWRPCPPRG